MKDPWEKAYVYGRVMGGGPRVAHIVMGTLSHRYLLVAIKGLCDMAVDHLSPTAEPYPICNSCLRTKRVKELGLR